MAKAEIFGQKFDFPLSPFNYGASSFYISTLKAQEPYEVRLSPKDEGLQESCLKLQSLYPNAFWIIDQRFSKKIKIPKPSLQVKAGEDCKTARRLLWLLEKLTQSGISKEGCLIALGGGSLLDLVGLAAGLYKRGITWISIPSTLLSQADSCIGGKTAINLSGIKNQIGMIHPPKTVILNSNCLITLSQDELLSGLGEIWKAHLIAGSSFLDQFEKLVFKDQLGLKELETLTLSALSVKKLIIQADEHDSFVRHSLNLGHTFAHALEHHLKIPHGQAVSLGILILNEISPGSWLFANKDSKLRIRKSGINLLSINTRRRLLKLEASWLSTRLLELLRQDKKSRGEMLNLVGMGQDLGKLEILEQRLDQKFVRKISQSISTLGMHLNLKEKALCLKF